MKKDFPIKTVNPISVIQITLTFCAHSCILCVYIQIGGRVMKRWLCLALCAALALCIPAASFAEGFDFSDLTLDELYAKADYITLHLPMNADTKGTVNAAAFAAMKDGVRIVNLARGELVDTAALKDALESGKCAAYVTDFPNSETAALDGVVCIPHLGASTPESEDNCAMMAARQVKDYLDNGNIVNSVNLPVLSMARAAKNRVCVIAKGADAAAVTAAVPGAAASASKTRGDYAYFLMDTDSDVDAAAIEAIPGVIKVRVLSK